MRRWVNRKKLALAGGTVLFGVALWRWHDDSAIASWVQAGFSVLAIVAAIWVAEMQADRQRRLEASREKATHVHRLEAIKAICKHAEQVLEEIAARRADSSYVDKPQVRRVEASQLEDARTALASIPLHDVAPWPVAEAVLALLRSTGDVREAIVNTQQLTASWTPLRGELFRVNAAAAKKAGASVQNVLNSVRGDESSPVDPLSSFVPPLPDMSSLVEAAHAPASDLRGNPATVHVQFSDGTQRDIISYFGGPQDPNVHPNLATITSSDPRYHVWYYALPDTARQGLPTPAKAA
ncbi:hypothetical protein M3I54_39980 [Paraburkholderia sp. CNPSo 3274]|uniref:hypothetical protein n=1 Tax=Paraburkholderia sp. CNPSo 3274 TaxID=2940932 RepID=UPI0020B659F5|nr:hypothetical protein [Paraburkholderia sp. CNPSo 3274]MCP3713003.1 hypothetical protein [Paraburkholderia sp. CNPSo 3274]